MKDSPTVSLFIQCLVDSMFPDVGEAMVKVLDRHGIDMTYPSDQTCCGQPAFNSGYRREAKVAARRFLDIFDSAEIIVCPSGSCVHMVKHHYPELFQDEPELLERARHIADRTFEFCQFLVDHMGIHDAGAVFPGKVTYHDSCHLSRGLMISSQPRQLLANTRDLEFIEMEESDTCCGFGGAFSVNYPEISTAMVDAKIEHILASGAEYVTGCDISCLMNISGRLARRKEQVKVLHIAEVLASTAGGSI